MIPSILSFSRVSPWGGVLLLLSLGFLPLSAEPASIQDRDVNGLPIAVNGTGRYTIVLYTNPDLEDAPRKMTLALDPFRARPDFAFVRVVDLRGEIPPGMRGIVRGQIRKEMAREAHISGIL